MSVVPVGVEDQQILEQNGRTARAVDLGKFKFLIAPYDCAVALDACGTVLAEVHIDPVTFDNYGW